MSERIAEGVRDRLLLRRVWNLEYRVKSLERHIKWAHMTIVLFALVILYLVRFN